MTTSSNIVPETMSAEEIASHIQALKDAGFDDETAHKEVDKFRAASRGGPTEEMKHKEGAFPSFPNVDTSTWPVVQGDYWKPAAYVVGGGLAAMAAQKGVNSIKSRMFGKDQTPGEKASVEDLSPETAHIGTNAEKVLNTAQGMPHLISEAEPISNVLGIPNERTGLNKPKLSVVENAPALEPINDPAEMAKQKQIAARQAQQKIIDQTPQIKDAVIAPKAGITENTSLPEAETLAVVSKNAQTPKEEVKGAVKPLLTGSGMSAVQGTAPPGTKFSKTVSGPHEIPSTHAFVPGGQLMDIVRNGVGQNEYLSSLKKSGGFPTTSQEAYQKVRDINESMSRLPRDVAKELGIGLGEPVKSITQKLPGGGKAITSGGIIGALVAMSDLANAGQSMKEKDPGMAWANLSQLLNAHPMGQVLQSIVSMSPEDLEASRRMIEREKHAKKVGGGRGLVNSGT